MSDSNPVTETSDLFAEGWARATAQHPVPLTLRAKVALEAATRVAEDTASVAAEPTLKLGQLEGIWAVIYARREAIEKLHGEALTDILKAARAVDWSALLDAAQRYTLLNPNLTGQQLARLLARDATRLLQGSLTPDELGAWQKALQAALLDATAEGQAAGMALISDASGVTIDFNLAAQAAKDALANDHVLWVDATNLASKQADGLAYDVSRALATLWDQQASREDMLATIEDLLNVGSKSAAAVLDTAIGQALSVGALTTYKLAGLQYADYITAGDGRVCADCGFAEDSSPYLLSEAPQPPIHVRCRCTLAPSGYTPAGNVLDLLDPYTIDTGEEAEAA